MRRDICCFYNKSTEEVFNAYVSAAQSKFGKDVNANPCASISFGLNFSFKYNMNGGACTIRFMSYNNGTAVNVRYSIAQAVGARYEAHCRDLTKTVEGILKTTASREKINVDLFLNYENDSKVAPAATPTSTPAPTPAPASDYKFCPECGQKLASFDKFCVSCGKAQF